MSDAGTKKRNIQCFLSYTDVSFGMFIKYISFGMSREVRKLVKGHGDIRIFQGRADRILENVRGKGNRRS